MKTLRNLKIAAVLMWFSSVLHAQEGVPAAGGESSGSGGSLSYTAGLVIYMTAEGNNGMMTQGIQQPYEILTGKDEVQWIDLAVSAYPNPVNDHLMLKVDHDMWRDLSYQLYDMSGKLLESKEIESPSTAIVMNKLNPSVYMLRVAQDKNVIKVFKIIKN